MISYEKSMLSLLVHSISTEKRQFIICLVCHEKRLVAVDDDDDKPTKQLQLFDLMPTKKQRSMSEHNENWWAQEK